MVLITAPAENCIRVLLSGFNKNWNTSTVHKDFVCKNLQIVLEKEFDINVINSMREFLEESKGPEAMQKQGLVDLKKVEKLTLYFDNKREYTAEELYCLSQLFEVLWTCFKDGIKNVVLYGIPVFSFNSFPAILTNLNSLTLYEAEITSWIGSAGWLTRRFKTVLQPLLFGSPYLEELKLYGPSEYTMELICNFYYSQPSHNRHLRVLNVFNVDTSSAAMKSITFQLVDKTAESYYKSERYDTRPNDFTKSGTSEEHPKKQAKNDYINSMFNLLGRLNLHEFQYYDQDMTDDLDGYYSEHLKPIKNHLSLMSHLSFGPIIPGGKLESELADLVRLPMKITKAFTFSYTKSPGENKSQIMKSAQSANVVEEFRVFVKPYYESFHNSELELPQELKNNLIKNTLFNMLQEQFSNAMVISNRCSDFISNFKHSYHKAPEFCKDHVKYVPTNSLFIKLYGKHKQSFTSHDDQATFESNLTKLQILESAITPMTLKIPEASLGITFPKILYKDLETRIQKNVNIKPPRSFTKTGAKKLTKGKQRKIIYTKKGKKKMKEAMRLRKEKELKEKERKRELQNTDSESEGDSDSETQSETDSEKETSSEEDSSSEEESELNSYDFRNAMIQRRIHRAMKQRREMKYSKSPNSKSVSSASETSSDSSGSDSDSDSDN